MRFAELSRALSLRGWSAFGAILSPPSKAFRISAADVEDRPALLYFQIKAALDAAREPHVGILGDYRDFLAAFSKDSRVAQFLGFVDRTRKTTFTWGRSLGAAPGDLGKELPIFLLLLLHPAGGFATFKVHVQPPNKISLESGHAVEFDDPATSAFWSHTWPPRALTEAELLALLEEARSLLLSLRPSDRYTVVSRASDVPANQGAQRMSPLIKMLTRRNAG